MGPGAPVRRSHGMRWARRIGAGLGVAALYVWDDLIFAVPIAAVTGVLGAWAAFAIFVPIFFVGSTVLALLAVRLYERSSHGEPSRLERWLEAQAASRRGRFAERVLRTSGAAGFVLASFVLGGVVTTWLIRYAGRRQGIERVAVASSLIFAVGFVAMYTGIFGLFF